MMQQAIRELQSHVQAKGWAMQIVPAARIIDIREAIEDLRRKDQFDKVFDQERLTFFDFDVPSGMQSLLAFAMPAPQFKAIFHWNGLQVPVLIPPTYVGYQANNARLLDGVGTLLGKHGLGVQKALIPLKTLAVRSGLARYGRNNISYVPGMGSFTQLVAAYSDLPAPADPWGEPRMLERCETCRACQKKCPTGAIGGERFLLHAERCLTFLNERVNDFPSWVAPAWHNSLIGCMHCQTICPEDKPYLSWVEEDGHFSEDDTRMLLEKADPEQFPPSLVERLNRLEMLEDARSGILGRNLSVLLHQRRMKQS
jgi:epoxyqueuosine reductase